MGGCAGRFPRGQGPGGDRPTGLGAKRAAIGAALWALALGCSSAVPNPKSSGLSIGLEGSGFWVSGLSPGELGELSKSKADKEEWARLFSVRVAGTDPQTPPLFGDYQVRDGRLFFEPRYPLRPGLTYQAVFHPSGVVGATGESGVPVTREFRVPVAQAGPPAVVKAVFPSTSQVPENLLKFYLHFSAPMSRGGVYQWIHLLRADGHPVELPFLELGEELWNPSGTRLTLLFDPGRIKRGLKPREDSGPSLEAGHSYTLVVDREWPDAEGRPLAQACRKSFSVGPPDEKPPSPASWKMALPRAGTRDPFRVIFEKPLDEAMLRRVISIWDSRGRAVRGDIELDQAEARWSFRPEQPWPAGRHALRIETTLEDLAGNSLERPFEVDVLRPLERSIGRKTVDLPFEIPAPGGGD